MRINVLLCISLLTVAGLAAGQNPLNEATSLYDRGQYQRVVDVLSQTALPQNDAEAYLLLGKSYLKLHKWDDAVREMQKAVQVAPSNSMYHLWLGRAYGEKASHSSFLSAAGWARKTGREFETAVQLSPKNVDARFDLLQFYLEAPGILGGGKDKAAAQVRAIAEVSPRQGFTAQAAVYEQDKAWDRARQELTQATIEFPRDPGAFIDLANFLLDRGDYPAAESNARKALELDPANASARYVASAADIAMRNNLAQARTTLAELSAGPLRDSDPSFEQVYYWLGKAYQEEGKTTLAREAYQTALRFDPDYGAAKSALAQLHT